MRFLVDSCAGGTLATWLRDEGHDVLEASTLESDPGDEKRAREARRRREIREAGAYTFEDVKAQLAQQVQRTKQIQRMLDQLRANTYIEIRM